MIFVLDFDRLLLTIGERGWERVGVAAGKERGEGGWRGRRGVVARRGGRVGVRQR